VTVILAVLRKAEGTGALLKTARRERGRGHVVQAAVRPVVVIIHAPAVRNISQLIDAQEQLSVKQFVPEPAVERLNIAVFPGTAGSDVQSPHARFLQPLLHGLRHKLRAVVAADVGRTTPNSKQVTQQFDNVPASEASRHIQRQTFPRILVDHNQQPDAAAVLQTLAEEVIAPNVVVMLGTLLVTAIGTRAVKEPLTLFLRHLEPFLAPETIHPFEVDQPVGFAQKNCDPTVAIPWMLQ